MWKPRRHGRVDPVEVVGLLPEVVGKRDQIVDTAEAGGPQVIQAAELVTASAGEPGVRRDRQAIWIVVAGRHGKIVGHREITVDAAEVRDVGRHVGEQLTLDAHGELPVVATMVPAAEGLGVDLKVDDGLAEVRGPRPALPVGRRVAEIAIRLEVMVGVRPASHDQAVQRIREAQSGER